MNGAIEKYDSRAGSVNSLLCVGLDPDVPGSQFEFNKWIIEQTAEYVTAYKPNMAFYEARGDRGLRELKMTMEYLQKRHPDIFSICDAKRADIGHTSSQYAKAIFDLFGFDAVTLNPYLGRDALQPFLDYREKVCIILCHTSNTGAGEFQEIKVQGKELWQLVAGKVVADWNKNGNCMLFMGATYPEEMQKVRHIAPDMTFLVAGIDVQGGKAKEVVQVGLNSQGGGLIINSSRGIIFAENPGEAARKLRDEINSYRQANSQ